MKVGQQVAEINRMKTNGVFSLSKPESLWGNPSFSSPGCHQQGGEGAAEELSKQAEFWLSSFCVQYLKLFYLQGCRE